MVNQPKPSTINLKILSFASQLSMTTMACSKQLMQTSNTTLLGVKTMLNPGEQKEN